MARKKRIMVQGKRYTVSERCIGVAPYKTKKQKRKGKLFKFTSPNGDFATQKSLIGIKRDANASPNLSKAQNSLNGY